jgi:hypothetical protein
MMIFVYCFGAIALGLLAVMLLFIQWAWSIIHELKNLDKPEKDGRQDEL